MKRLIKKLFNTNISTSYMFILLGISSLMMLGYFSYAWFTVQGVQKYSVVTGNLTGTLAIGDKSITITGSGVISYTPTTNQDVITITVTNTSDRTTKNSIYYYSPADTNIVVGYTAESETIPTTTGVTVVKGKSLTYKIAIINAKGKEIKIGSSMGLANADLSLPENTKEIVKTEDSYCKYNGFTTLSDCMLVMNSHEDNVDTAKTNIKAKGTPDFSQIATTDEGLYMAEDDEGESYYYRGAVKNNYVSFAGFIWRIIRRNGDGSIRMIYSGKSTTDTGDDTMIGYSKFNDKYWDPTYVGYKYNEDFSLYENNLSISMFGYFNNTSKYDFGTSYIFDETTKKFILTGDIKQLTWNDDHDEIVNNQLYSCLNTNCYVIYKIVKYDSDTRMTVVPVNYGSNNYQNTLLNTIDSTIKQKIDQWYEKHLINYFSYLADETFCNDRSVEYGSGYKIDDDTFYNAYKRNAKSLTPSLKCSQISDQFKISNERAKLDYPIALITADEVTFAGGRSYNDSYFPNNGYYLFNNGNYWTMSPSVYGKNYSTNHLYNVVIHSSLHPWNKEAGSVYGIRPVINLRSNAKITKGDGSVLNPFVVET